MLHRYRKIITLLPLLVVCVIFAFRYFRHYQIERSKVLVFTKYSGARTQQELDEKKYAELFFERHPDLEKGAVENYLFQVINEEQKKELFILFFLTRTPENVEMRDEILSELLGAKNEFLRAKATTYCRFIDKKNIGRASSIIAGSVRGQPRIDNALRLSLAVFHLEGRSSVAFFQELADAPDSRLQLFSTIALYSLTEKKIYLKKIAHAIKGKDIPMKKLCILMMGDTYDSKMLPLLKPLVNDRDNKVRENVIFAIHQIREPENDELLKPLRN